MSDRDLDAIRRLVPDIDHLSAMEGFRRVHEAVEAEAARLGVSVEELRLGGALIDARRRSIDA